MTAPHIIRIVINDIGQPTRLVLEAVLWESNTGAQWHVLQVLTEIADDLRERGAHRAETKLAAAAISVWNLTHGARV